MGGMKSKAAIWLAAALMVAATGRCDDNGKDWEARREAALDQMRTFVYNTDGCDILYWPTNQPVSVAAFTDRRLKYALNSRIAVVSYCPQSAGFGHFTCRKAGEPLTNTVTAIHRGNPSARNAAADFFAIGTDSLEMASAFCRTNGLGIFVSIRVNDQHDRSSSVENGYSALFPPFKKAHPEYLMGSIDRSKNKHLFCGGVSWSCVDFTHREVRERMKGFVRQFVDNYDVDGIEYDFNRHFILFKSVAEGGVASEDEKALMTELMRDLRKITEAAGRKRGKPIVVCMRAPDSVGYDNACGIDLERWFAERLVDVWIGAGYFHLNPWEDSVALARKHGIRFYASIDESRIEGKAKAANAPFIPGRTGRAAYAARFAEAMAAGADGVYVFNLEGPHLNNIAQIDGAHSEGENKLYFVRFRGTGGYRPESWLKDGGRFDNLPNIDPGLPKDQMTTHKPGERYSFNLTVGDNLAVVNPPPRITVKALTNLKAGDEIGLSVNGQKLEAGACKNGLFTCNAPAGAVRKGRNEFSVTFPSRDGKYTLNDFAVEIRYR